MGRNDGVAHLDLVEVAHRVTGMNRERIAPGTDSA